MSFSDHVKQNLNEKNREASAFNREPDKIPALKTGSPKLKIGTGKGNFDKFLGKRAHKKALFSPKKRVKRSNTDVALGRRKRKGGKTKNARSILANKHGMKKANQKDQNAEFYIDHLQVAEMMKRFGYDWEQEDGEWSNKEDRVAAKPKKKRKKEIIPGTKRKKISSFGNKDDAKVSTDTSIDFDPTNFSVPQNGQDVEVPEEDLTDFTMIGAGGIEYDINEEDLMAYQGRLILGLIHGGKSAMHFEEVEETEEDSDVEDGAQVTVITIEPIIDREKVLDKVESLGYSYFPQVDEWRIDNKFPFEDNAEGEDKKSIIGRTYLAALGHFEVFDFDEEDNPIAISKEDVTQMLLEFGFIWDEESSTWKKQQLSPDESH
jgi:hypothetical protein